MGSCVAGPESAAQAARELLGPSQGGLGPKYLKVHLP